MDDFVITCIFYIQNIVSLLIYLLDPSLNMPLFYLTWFIFLVRMTSACQRKCVPTTYRDSDLSKGEAVCLDRCVTKYLEV